MTKSRAAVVAALLAATAAPAPAAYAQTSPAAEQVQRPTDFVASSTATTGVLVLPLASVDQLDTRGGALSDSERAAVRNAIAAADHEFSAGSRLALRGIGGWTQILLVGLGDDAEARTYERAGAVAGRALLNEDAAITIVTTGLDADAVANFATGLGLGQYRSDLYHRREREPSALGQVTFVADAPDHAERAYTSRGRALVEAMAWTRDVSNEPANVLYPETFVSRARAAFGRTPGVGIQVLDVPAMRRFGMGALLGVGQGSARPPRMMIVSYRGEGAPAQPVVLAGKGITFDSGGISIKPNAGMANMRMDMSGAASVTGAVLALARSRAPVHVVAVAALAENMPDGAAIRPGDVLTAMNGMTIEIISTDAEGRLVLADALAWIEANLNAAAIVDVATLTGAVGTALGDDYAGLFTRHEELGEQLQAAGASTGERLWRLPLDPSYASDTASTIADIKNSGEGGAGAGVGAHFIGEFVSRDTPWAHIDIAGVAWSGANDWKPAGSAGFGVRLLERFVRDFQPIETPTETAE